MDSTELEGIQTNEPAVLQLHSWGSLAVPVSAFATAALSPSRKLLLLQSHEHEVVLLPLAGPSNATPSNELRVSASSRPDLSSSQLFPPATPPDAATVRALKTLKSAPGQSSNSHETVSSKAGSHSAPDSQPLNPVKSLSNPPDTEGNSPSVALSPSGVLCLPYPVLSDVHHFTWAHHGDGFGSKGPSGLFKELLFISNKEGLFIHCLLHKYFSYFKETDSKEPSGPIFEKPPLRTNSGANFKGQWRNWGQFAVDDIVQGMEEKSEDESQHNRLVDNGAARFGSSQVKNVQGNGKEHTPFLENTETGEDCNDEHRRVDRNGCPDDKHGLVSYVMDAELEAIAEGLELRFDGDQCWPSSAEVVSYKFAAGSQSFSLLSSRNSLKTFKSRDSLNSDRKRTPEKDGPREGLNQEPLVSSVWSLDEEKCSGIVDIISNPSYNLVGIVTCEGWPDSEYRGQQKVVNGQHKRRSEVNKCGYERGPKLGVLGNAVVSIVMVLEWGVKWIAWIDLKEGISKEAGEIPWTSFVLTSNRLLGLKEDGRVFMWAAFTGNLLAFIDVVSYCGLTPARLLAENKDAFKDTSDTLAEKAQLRTDTDEEPSSHISCNEETMLPGNSESAKFTVLPKGSGEGHHRRHKRQFTNLVATANCLLLVVTDDQGILFLVSTADYFASLGSRSTSSQEIYSGQEALKVLSYWDVGGSDIGTPLPASQLPDRRWLRALQEEPHNAENSEDAYAISRQKVSVGIKGRPGPHKKVSALQVASGFTSRVEVARNGAANVSKMRAKQPIRNVFLPYKRAEPPVVVALDSYAITSMIQSTESKETFTVTQNILHILSRAVDERDLYKKMKEKIEGQSHKRGTYFGDTLPFCSQGLLYMVTGSSLHVVLPPLSVSGSKSAPSLLVPREQKLSTTVSSKMPPLGWAKTRRSPRFRGPVIGHWQSEVLDRALVCDGLEEAELLCAENGWSLQLFRLRRLQVALDFVQPEDVEHALEGLVHVGAADSGVLCVIFAAIELMLNQYFSDNELAQAARFLSLAASFTTRLVRQHGIKGWQSCGHQQKRSSLSLESSRYKTSAALTELTQFLEVIRSLQDGLHDKRRWPNRKKGESKGDGIVLRSDGPYSNAKLESIEEGNEENIAPNAQEQALGVDEKAMRSAPLFTSANEIAHLGTTSSSALVTTGSFPGGSLEIFPTGVEGGKSRRRSHLESPNDMFMRWENENVDAAGVVRDALKSSGRLALAVAQLHRLRMMSAPDVPPSQGLESDDVFGEVLQIGRGIVYELFCKGKTALAMAALRRLGEDIETVLRELALGTVRRFLHTQAVKELRRLTHLSAQDFQLFERVSLIETVYANSSFWRTYGIRTNVLEDHPAAVSTGTETKLSLVCDNPLDGALEIKCGEVEGVVVGTWSMIDDPEVVEDVYYGEESTSTAYWAAAPVWLQSWDQRIVDRVLLEQPRLEDKLTSWEAMLNFNLAHHHWEEVVQLLETIPSAVLREGVLHVELDWDDSVSYNPSLPFPGVLDSAGRPRHHWPDDEQTGEAVIQKIQVLELDLISLCSTWMWQMIEDRLVKNHIFVRVQWKGTVEIMSLFARAGLLSHGYVGGRNISSRTRDGPLHATFSGPIKGSKLHKDAVCGVHEVVVQHCVRHTLAHFFELYVDFHSLAQDKGFSSIIHSLVGDCPWALWLLYSGLPRRQYDASFANARTILAPSSRGVEGPDIGNFLPTVDDIAEVGGEIMAVSTLMYAPVSMQKCLCAGSVSRHGGRSWQCTLESLQPGLHSFPTLWRTLVGACFVQDTWGFAYGHPLKAGGRGGLAQYLEWRQNLFSSAGDDTSILQMIPRWLPRSVGHILHLTMQGPVGGGLVTGQQGSEANSKGLAAGDKGAPMETVESLETLASAWETTVQKLVEEEHHAPSSEDTGLGCEHYIRRGQGVSAFRVLLSSRVNSSQDLKSGHGRLSTSEIQALFLPITSHEEKLLAPVLPLAILNNENSVVVAACTMLIELCGLSANLLRVDVAALTRISNYIKSEQIEAASSHGGTAAGRETMAWASAYGGDVVVSLARSLADDYLHGGVKVLSKADGPQSTPSKTVVTVLQLLEKASLKDEVKRVEGASPGAWLFSGQGDGVLLRTMQRSMSERWSLVTAFCRAHHLPLSTTYLAALARDNDWVGFLAEAQLEGCPLDLLLAVVSKEFTNPRLQSQLLFILKSLPGASEKSAGSALQLSPLLSSLAGLESGMGVNVELFALLADCEHSKHPGKDLLAKAKDSQWPLLAVVASCFTDVTSQSCLTTWLEITAVKETAFIQITDEAAQISTQVGAAVDATNAIAGSSPTSEFRFSRKSPKRRRCLSPEEVATPSDKFHSSPDQTVAGLNADNYSKQQTPTEEIPNWAGEKEKSSIDGTAGSMDGGEELESLAALVVVLCEQQRFLPLLRAFELFTPTSSFLPYLRFLQAFSQMRISEASAHLAAFTARLKDETYQQHFHARSGKSSTAWITRAAIAAADAIHGACPSAYERRCLLQLLSGSDFGDGGMAAMRFRRLYWKIQLGEPALGDGSDLITNGANLDDEALFDTLEKNSQWEQARSWARQLDPSNSTSALHRVTETQAEAMVTEWKELLWDVPEERVALWNHCQALFTMHAFPAIRAGKFFLKHADAVEPEVSSSELHNILLMALQWLSGSVTNSVPIYPLHLLQELETRVWLLAVESSVETQDGRDSNSLISMQSTPVGGLSHEISVSSPVIVNPVDRTAAAVAVVDSHLKKSNLNKFDGDEVAHHSSVDMATSSSCAKGNSLKFKRRHKDQSLAKWPRFDTSEGTASESEEGGSRDLRPRVENKNDGQELQPGEITVTSKEVMGSWEERFGEKEVEQSVLALLEVGQVTAAKQLQQKMSPAHAPLELSMVETALKVAELSSLSLNGSVGSSTIPPAVIQFLQTSGLLEDVTRVSPIKVLEALTEACQVGCGQGLCCRISAVARIADTLGLTFSDAFSKPPTELLQLLALKGQGALVEAKLLVATHSMPPASAARILAESFLKGLLAAHRGGYMQSSLKEEGPAPLLWRPSDFIRWAQVCSSEPEIGHALMRLVISGRDMPHACEVELIILAHRYYESSACLDGVDVLVALAATRVDSYVAEGDYSSLARLVTGISNFQALHFILDLLIENGQLELLLQKRSVVDAAMESSASIRGFRMAVLSALKHFNPHDLDAFELVYSNFSMAHEMAALLESRGQQTLQHWANKQYDPEQSQESLDMMRLYVEAAKVYSGIDAGNKTTWCCAQASLISLQLRVPDHVWLNLTDTNARRLLVDQPRFQESLIVAEAYRLNQSAEWVPVIWNQMQVPGRIDQFLNDFVAALPLTYLMLMELARFYRLEVAARRDQHQLDFSKWLTPGGIPVELARHLNKSFRSLLKHTRDMKERLQLATVATGFPDVVDMCIKVVDNMPVTAGPLILRKGHGGTYLPIM